MRLTASSPPRPATTSSRVTFKGASIGNLLVEANLGQVDTPRNQRMVRRSGRQFTNHAPLEGGTMANGLWRALVILHRYLGVAVGLLMAVWFASGIVMMYVGFPRLTEAERVRALAPIPWQACCQFGEQLADDQPIVRAQLESHLGEPALRLRRVGARDGLVDLARGASVAIDAEAARRVALMTAPRIIGREANVVAQEEITTDQWSVGRYFRERPLHRVDLDDPDRTSVYVAGTAGQVVLTTTATQ